MTGVRCRAFAIACASLLMPGADALAAHPEPEVSTIAGSGLPGNADGPGDSASFLAPAGIATAPDGTIAVSDPGGERIRIIRRGVVETLAGGGDLETTGDSVAGGFRNGPGADARFDEPSGLAYLPDGTLLVADKGNHCIRAIRSATVTTFAGNPNVAGVGDGSTATATFTSPLGLAVDDLGDIFVADDGAGLREIRNGAVSTIALPPATENRALAVAVDGHGAARRLFVSTFSGLVTLDGDPSGPGVPHAGPAEGGRRIGYPYGLFALNHNALVFADAEDQTVRLLRLPARSDAVPMSVPLVEDTIEDGANNGGGFRDGDLRDALFRAPQAIARSTSGDVLVADTGNRRIRSIPAEVLRLPHGTGAGTLPAGRTWIVGGSASYYDTLWGTSIPGKVEAAGEIGVDALQYDDENPADVERALALALAAKPRHVVWMLTTRELASIGGPALAAMLHRPSLAATITVCVVPLAGDIASAETIAMLATDPGADPTEAQTHYAALQRLVRASKIPFVDVAAQFQRFETASGGADLYATLSPYLTDEGRAMTGEAIATALAQRNVRPSAPTPNR